MKNIEDIAQVDGVDGVFIGPSDLAASMGLLGQPLHDGVRSEVKRGLQIIRRHGKIAGTLALREDIAQEYMEVGAQFLGVGLDLNLLATATESLAKKYK